MVSHIAMKPRRAPRAEPRVCAHCGRQVFTLRPIDYERPEYCSLACRYEDQSLEEVAAELNAWRGSGDDNDEETDDD